MGRWAQAQRRGKPPVAVTPPVSTTLSNVLGDAVVEWTRAEDPDAFEVELAGLVGGVVQVTRTEPALATERDGSWTWSWNDYDTTQARVRARVGVTWSAWSNVLEV